MKAKKSAKIEWKKVTWYSTALAVILYVGVFLIGFYLGQKMNELKTAIEQIPTSTYVQKQTNNNTITAANFDCKNGKTINAIFFDDKVELTLSEGSTLLLLRAVSGSGARYTNTGETYIFWNKGDTAFLEEGSETTYEDCVVVPAE
ncbi:MAG: MliC family protein [Candidatus Paceibacterota bacterium]|jgi:membrane-bound inhibitor of C-type lysozyme